MRGWINHKDEGGRELGEAILAVHDVATNKELGKLELDANALDFGFAGSNAVVVLAGRFHATLPPSYTLSRWNAPTLKREWEVAGPSLPNKFSLRLIVAPGGKRFAFTDQLNFVHMHDVGTGKLVVEPSGHDAWVLWVGFSPDGERITTVGRDGLRTWTTTSEWKSVLSLPELARGWIAHAITVFHSRG